MLKEFKGHKDIGVFTGICKKTSPLPQKLGCRVECISKQKCNDLELYLAKRTLHEQETPHKPCFWFRLLQEYNQCPCCVEAGMIEINVLKRNCSHAAAAVFITATHIITQCCAQLSFSDSEQ